MVRSMSDTNIISIGVPRVFGLIIIRFSLVELFAVFNHARHRPHARPAHWHVRRRLDHHCHWHHAHPAMNLAWFLGALPCFLGATGLGSTITHSRVGPQLSKSSCKSVRTIPPRLARLSESVFLCASLWAGSFSCRDNEEEIGFKSIKVPWYSFHLEPPLRESIDTPNK